MAPYRDEDPSPPCPRCGSPLLGGACARCGGAFVPRDRLVDPSFTARIAMLSRLVPQEALRCPLCQSEMRRMNVSIDGGEVLIDACDRHGTWFDRDEIEQLGVHPSVR